MSWRKRRSNRWSLGRWAGPRSRVRWSSCLVTSANFITVFHLLNGGLSPAERTGMISIGDELLAANNLSLDNISFEEVIETASNVSANELCLRLRKIV